MMKTFVIPLLLYLCTGAVSLPHYNNFQEEACSARGIQPLKNFNRKFVSLIARNNLLGINLFFFFCMNYHTLYQF